MKDAKTDRTSEVATTIASDPAGLGRPLTERETGRTRYQRTRLLGEGGMGEVHLCGDTAIGRDVAMKVLSVRHRGLREMRLCFSREARIQGQLEHPSVVPVYDAGLDGDGVEFFTMKRVNGTTLSEVMRALRSQDQKTVSAFTRDRLLGVFLQVCQGVAYAHARGVIHRDLKPANLMIGDYGEVYVLDWGLAKVAGRDASTVDTGDDEQPVTAEGQVMGTPGYMSPEQAAGASNVDARADVYALGAILFELLTQERLHRGSGALELLRSTQLGAEARPSVRAPDRDVPDELEEVCVRATSSDPDLRFPNAAPVCEAIERFLARDRDAERQRELSKQHAECAREAVRAMLLGGKAALEERVRALQEIGRALALDPTAPGARRALADVLSNPLDELPPDAKAAQAIDDEAEDRASYEIGVWAYACSASLILIGVLWSGVRSPVGIAGVIGPLVMAGVVAAIAARAAHPPGVVFLALIVLSSASIAITSGLYGPLVLVPALATSNALSYTTGFKVRPYRWVPVAVVAASFVVPFFLEWGGALPPSYSFRRDALVVMPHFIELPELVTRLALIVTSIGVVVVPALQSWKVSDALDRARERLHLHVWQLGKLLPPPSRPLPDSAPDAGEPRVHAGLP